MTENTKKEIKKENKELAEGYLIYKKVCQIMNWEDEILFFHGKIKTIEIIYLDKTKDMKLEETVYSKDYINDLIGKPATVKLTKYLMQKKCFRAKPFLVKEGYVCYDVTGAKDGFVFRDELLDKSMDYIKEWMSRKIVKINYKTGEILSSIPMAKIEDNNIKYLDKLLSIIFPNNKEKLMAMQFASLYAFENRYGLSKPTLVMYGEHRATGKNMFIEHVIGSIYPGQIQPVASNSDSFTAGLSNKGLFYDEETETSKSGNSNKFYDKLKKDSGSLLASINIKGKEAFSILSGCYIMIASQEKPFHLRDKIEDPENNQFLIFNTVLSKKEQFADLQKEITGLNLGYRNISHFIQKNIGSYIWSVLFPVYKAMKLEGKARSFRYGMEVPITAGSLDIQAKSVTNTQENCVQLMENLFFNESRDYRLEGDDLVYFNNFAHPITGLKGYIPVSFKNRMLKRCGVNETAFDFFILNFKLLIRKDSRAKIDVSNNDIPDIVKPRCYKIDYERLTDLIKENNWFPKVIDVTEKLSKEVM